MGWWKWGREKFLHSLVEKKNKKISTYLSTNIEIIWDSFSKFLVIMEKGWQSVEKSETILSIFF